VGNAFRCFRGEARGKWALEIWNQMRAGRHDATGHLVASYGAVAVRRGTVRDGADAVRACPGRMSACGKRFSVRYQRWRAPPERNSAIAGFAQNVSEFTRSSALGPPPPYLGNFCSLFPSPLPPHHTHSPLPTPPGGPPHQALFYSHQLRSALADLRLLRRRGAKASAVHQQGLRLDPRYGSGTRQRIIREGRPEQVGGEEVDRDIREEGWVGG
jgi:hypothetical protein